MGKNISSDIGQLNPSGNLSKLPRASIAWRQDKIFVRRGKVVFIRKGKWDPCTPRPAGYLFLLGVWIKI
eukprot:1136416-Pelagomonas_calceolata.AAC.1